MDDLLLADGFERAFLGVVFLTVVGETVAVYDRAVCITVLVERDGMTEEEAEEFFEFNVAGAFVGDQTPLFLERQAYPGYE
jgi:hypothetical protein